jgi:hypothetical protein
MATATNKPRPAQPPTAKPAKPAKPAKQPDGGDKLPLVKRVALRVSRAAEMAQNQLDKIKSWPGDTLTGPGHAINDVRTALASAIDALKHESTALASLPDDFKPRTPKGQGSKTELLPGSFVRITDKRVGEYEGVLEPAQMRGMRVTEVRGNKVFVMFKDGDKEVRGMFARGHVCPDLNPVG